MIPMKCRSCAGEMIQKSRPQLFVVGVLMIASLALGGVLPFFWGPGILLALIGTYLIVWATLGKGCWCRNCKKFNLS